jgi:N4-gp56 family major capsid protein
MADTSYGVNHPLAVKIWSRKLLHEALKQTWFSKFIGTDSNSIVYLKTDLQKGPGDRVRCGLRMLLTGDGVQGDNTLEGSEEQLVTFYDDLFINQLRHAVRSAGKMSEQRVPFSVREEARLGLTDWWAERLDVSFFNQLSGNTAVSDTRYSGNNATLAPTTIVFGGDHAAVTSLTASTSNALTLRDFDKAVAIAKTRTPMIRPIRMGGDDYYVAFIHTNAVYQLRGQTATAQWADIEKAKVQGGKESGIFTGAIGVYNNVIFHETTRLPDATGIGTPATGAATDYRRAVLCGAQALLLGYGQDGGSSVSWTEELFDYKNKLGVEGGMIFGMKKAQFNGADYGVLTLVGYAPALA